MRPTTGNPACEQANRLIDWYWSQGFRREGQFALPLGTWLDRAYAARDGFRSDADPAGNLRGTVAVWGPSQSGKSTLISKYIDHAADARGAGSALHWPQGGRPARFVIDPNTPADQRPADAIVLNPYNVGADASGCVSRYILRDDADVPDPAHPVEVRLASRGQVMQALAAGYLSECRLADDAGLTAVIDPTAYQALLDDEPQSNIAPDRDAYEVLQDLVDALDQVVASESPRFPNLRSKWTDLRRQTLSGRSLAGDRKRAVAFAARVLWDARPALSDTFAALTTFGEDLARQWGGRPVFCSLDVAALLLDIGSYGVLTSDRAESPAVEAVRGRVRDLARSLRCDHQEDRIVISKTGSHPLVRSDLDFGLLQALVWELVIPLRQGAVERASPAFAAFLRTADLLDFPGVALAHGNVDDDRLSVDVPSNTLAEATRQKLLTRVLKRGKTASIVTGYAKGRGIDAFALFVRTGHYPPQPQQLHAGIKAWWRHIDPVYQPGSRSQPPLPLNLVLTFFAKLVHDLSSGGGQGGLDPVFTEMVGKLGVLADPGVVTTFATTYGQFRDGELPEPHLLAPIATRIKQDAAFTRQFSNPTSAGSFDHMLADGGTDYLFQSLAAQVNPAERGRLIDRLAASAQRELLALAEEAFPAAGDADEARRQVLGKLGTAIEAALIQIELAGEAGGQPVTDSAAYCGTLIRRLLHVDAEALAPIPLNAVTSRTDLLKYVQAQFAVWVNGRPADLTRAGPLPGATLATIGLDDPGELSKVLHAIMDAARKGDVAEWVKRNFGYVDTRAEARSARRQLAMRMSAALAEPGEGGPDGRGRRAHRPLNGDVAGSTKDLLRRFGDHEQGMPTDRTHRFLESPHYPTVVEPFMAILEHAKTGSAGHRPGQIGDAEVRVIADALRAIPPVTTRVVVPTSRAAAVHNAAPTPVPPPRAAPKQPERASVVTSNSVAPTPAAVVAPPARSVPPAAFTPPAAPRIEPVQVPATAVPTPTVVQPPPPHTPPPPPPKQPVAKKKPGIPGVWG